MSTSITRNKISNDFVRRYCSRLTNDMVNYELSYKHPSKHSKYTTSIIYCTDTTNIIRLLYNTTIDYITHPFLQINGRSYLH